MSNFTKKTQEYEILYFSPHSLTLGDNLSGIISFMISDNSSIFMPQDNGDEN
jgi:hypothetical protein